jgi:RNA polymerase sigma factor (sigma-70 family)
MGAEEQSGRLLRAEPGVTDAELISSSVVEPDRFAELFRRHAPALQRYAIRRLGPAKAEDLVAETFFQAFRQRQRYRIEWPDARPWLYGIATNLISRERRAEVRQYRAFARTGVDSQLVQFSDEVEARVSAASLDRLLAGVLAGLPAKQREALLLVAWAELSYVEAAQALGVPVGTVRSRISRARARLRDGLADAQRAAEPQSAPNTTTLEGSR